MSDGAFTLQAIPDLINQALFAGDNIEASKIFLVAFILLCVMLPMLMTKLKPNAMIPIMVIVILACTAVGWVSETLVMVLLLVIAGSIAIAASKVLG